MHDRTTTEQARENIRAAIKAAGGYVTVANRLGYRSTAALGHWITGRNALPVMMVPKLCRLAGGQFTPKQIRPDVFDSEAICQTE